jgi:hypothetical protein
MLQMGATEKDTYSEDPHYAVFCIFNLLDNVYNSHVCNWIRRPTDMQVTFKLSEFNFDRTESLNGETYYVAALVFSFSSQTHCTVH